MKAGNNSSSLSHSAPSSQPSTRDDFPEEESTEESDTYYDQNVTHDQDKKVML